MMMSVLLYVDIITLPLPFKHKFTLNIVIVVDDVCVQIAQSVALPDDEDDL